MLLIIFLLSGIPALIYEVVWVRLLALAFGTTTGATALVIGAFMAGLGFGSIYWGKRVDASPRPVRLFGLLQFGIAITSFIIIIIFKNMPAIYRVLFFLLDTGSSVSLIFIFIISFILMFVPTFLMGGTFPVMSKAFIQRNTDIGSGIGTLYAVNTCGGIIGAGAAGFVLIAQTGLTITQGIALAINLMLSIITIKISVTKNSENKGAKSTEKIFSDRVRRFILIVAGFTGFAGLAYEILWIRALAIFLPNSTYTFSSVLIIFLTGITIGSIVYTKFLNTIKRHFFLLAGMQAFIGAYAIVTTLFLHRLPGLLFTFSRILIIPLFKIALPSMLLASVIMLIPTIFMGISFPLICKIYNKSINRLGSGVGNVYFYNTIGSVVGSLGAGFLLIPFVGVLTSIVFIALLNFVVGSVLVFLQPSVKGRALLFWPGAGVAALLVLWALILTPRLYILPPSLYVGYADADEVLYYKETRDGTVIVREDPQTKVRGCHVNNSTVIGTSYDGLKVVKMLGHLPFLVNPRAQNALIIGFGIGVTTAAIARHDLEYIDCVEICPGVREAAHFFTKFNDNVQSDPAVNFISGDGRNYLLLTEKKYDVISCDPTHPILGSGNLYTKEYFELCKEHLADNGVVVQYLPFHKMSPKEFRSLVKTFTEVFPHASVWLGHSHGILLGTDHLLYIDFQEIKKLVSRIQDDILNDPYLLATALLFDEEDARNFGARARVHTDDHPFFDFFTIETQNPKNWEINLREVYTSRSNIRAIFYNIDDPDRMSRYLLGQAYFISALMYHSRNDPRSMFNELKKGAFVNPENNEIKTFLERLSTR